MCHKLRLSLNTVFSESCNCLGHAHPSDRTPPVAHHLHRPPPWRVSRSRFSPYDRWACCQECILSPFPSPQSSGPWFLFCISIVEGRFGEEPMARDSGKRKQSSSYILLTFLQISVLAMKAWQCGRWFWQCGRWWWPAALEDLSKRREAPPATSSRTLALIFTPLAVILRTCLFTLTRSPWPWPLLFSFILLLRQSPNPYS